MLARLATRRAKPANSYHLLLDRLSAFIEPLEITDLHGFGYNTKQKGVGETGYRQAGGDRRHEQKYTLRRSWQDSG